MKANDINGKSKGVFKRVIGILLIVIMLISLTACLKPVSLEDYGYVISVGVDKGTQKKYYITLMLQRESSGQSPSDSEGGVIILAAECDDVFDCIGTIESNIPYILNFSRTSFLIFSSEAAREGLIKEFLELPLDALRIRASAILIITRDTVSAFIGGLAANNDANVTKLQTSILLDREKTGMVSIMSVSRMYEACVEGRYDICTALGAYDECIITDMGQKKSEGEGEDPISDSSSGERIGGLKSYIAGSALFDGWTMSGELDRDETMLLNIVNDEFKTGIFAFEKEGETVTVVLEAKKANKRFEGFDKESSPCFLIDVSLYAAVHMSGAEASAESAQRLLDNELSEIIEESLYALFEKCRDANCDAMRLGTYISKSFASVEDWESFDWKTLYPSARVRFNVEISAVDKYASEGRK